MRGIGPHPPLYCRLARIQRTPTENGRGRGTVDWHGCSGVSPTPCRNLDGGQWGGVLTAIHLGCPPLNAAGGEVRGEDEGHRIRWCGLQVVGSLVLAPVGETPPAQVIGEHIHCQALQLVTAADGVGGNAAALESDLHAAGQQRKNHGVGCGAGVGGVEIHGGDGEVVGEGEGGHPSPGHSL